MKLFAFVFHGVAPRAFFAPLQAAFALALLAAPASTRADDFVGLGVLPGGTASGSQSVSANGLVVVGFSTSTFAAGDLEAFRWTASGMVGLGLLPGYASSIASGVNADGSVVVGSNFDVFGSSQAFRWTSGGMVGLGFLPLAAFNDSRAYGVNGDGSVVVGYSGNAANSNEAFRWTSAGMVGLGYLPGGTYSEARRVSADGAVVVGYGDSTNSATSEAFRWTSGGGMVGLGFLGGNVSRGFGVSANGAVVVGESVNANGNFEAFRWTSGGMVGLGFLPGGNSSAANAANADGTVVVGTSSTTNTGGGAFRWTSFTGIKSIRDLLVASGVNITGWTLSTATGVSADGSVIVGNGSNPASQSEAWLVRCTTNCALITPDTVARSFASIGAVGQTGAAAIGSTLGTMIQYATQGGPGNPNSPFSVFASGAYDTDPTASGTLGGTYRFGDAMIAGATLGADFIKTNMSMSGSAKMDGGAAGAFIARVPESGLQWLAGAGGLTLKGDITRGYLNGNTPAFSTGSTKGNGYGVTGRIGWTFDALANTKITPFASYTFTEIGYDGYTETTGPFAATINAFTDRAHTSRIGSDVRYTFAPGAWAWGTAVWAHRLDGGKSADVSGALIGLFSLGTPGYSLAKDWAETTAGLRFPIWQNGSVSASATASLTPGQVVTFLFRGGVAQAF